MNEKPSRRVASSPSECRLSIPFRGSAVSETRSLLHARERRPGLGRVRLLRWACASPRAELSPARARLAGAGLQSPSKNGSAADAVVVFCDGDGVAAAVGSRRVSSASPCVTPSVASAAIFSKSVSLSLGGWHPHSHPGTSISPRTRPRVTLLSTTRRAPAVQSAARRLKKRAKSSAENASRASTRNSAVGSSGLSNATAGAQCFANAGPVSARRTNAGARFPRRRAAKAASASLNSKDQHVVTRSRSSNVSFKESAEDEA